MTVSFLSCGLLLSAALGAATQHPVLLRPTDAVQLAETSQLFRAHYLKKGCPVASASLAEHNLEIALRLEDGCLGGVSTWAGDFVVNRMSGEVRESLGSAVVVGSTDDAVVGLWLEIESQLLDDHEATCLVQRAASVVDWKKRGVPMLVRVDHDDGDHQGFFSVDVIPRANTPSAPQRVLRYQVDRREYKLYEGRFRQEELGADVLVLRDLLRAAKRPIELTEGDVLEEVRHVPEVDSWLKGNVCRGVRLEEDQQGMTYYSVDLFEWCKGDKRSVSVASFAVDKRSGNIRASQDLVMTTSRIPNAGVRLAAVKMLSSAGTERLRATCPKTGQ